MITRTVHSVSTRRRDAASRLRNRWACHFVFFVSLFFPAVASAEVRVSELLWMGSDQSTADEWIELVNTSEEEIDISGWTIWYKNSSGIETTMLTIPDDSFLPAGEYFLIANFDAEHSRLSIDPDMVTTDVSLPNTNLLVKLFDADGNLVDQVDDGNGAPFAGSNSASAPKASMERIDFLASGTAASNWRTATVSTNFDAGSPIFGTPKSENGGGSSSSSSSSSSSCTDPLEIAIDVQSGELTGIGRTTVNVQAIATAGSLSGLSCTFDFGDGKRTTSCNPGPHAYDSVGIFLMQLSVLNRCGVNLSRTLLVRVEPDPTAVSGASSSVPYDGAHIAFVSALPNPVGADTNAEIIELINLSSAPTNLAGWKLVTETTTKKTYVLKGTLSAQAKSTIYSSEIKFTLPNGATTLTLLDPRGTEHSRIVYENAEEGRQYFPEDVREFEIAGQVIAVLDATTFVLEVSPSVRAKTGMDTLLVRLIGVEKIDTQKSDQAAFQMSGAEWLRALIQKKNVALQFGTMLWTADGMLLAEVFGDGNYSIAEDGLTHGMLQSANTPHKNKEKYDALVEIALKQKRGLWAYVKASSSSSSSSSQSSSASSKNKVITIDPATYAALSISEVYPSPFPASEKTSESDPLLFEEWIELKNAGLETLDLSGWILTTGTKKKTLPKNVILKPESFSLLTKSIVSLGLKNSGGEISLSSPDGSIILTLTYPTIKNGMAYAVDSVSNEHCITTEPTPEAENACIDVVPVNRSVAAKKAAATRKANTIAGYVGLFNADIANAAGSQIVFSDASHSGVPSIAFLLLALGFGLVSGIGGAWWMIKTEMRRLSSRT